MDAAKTVWEAVSNGQDHVQLGDVEMPARAYLARFGFRGADQNKLVGMLSGGERNRLNLALTLERGGNVLLRFPGCAIVTAHDRWFLDRVATHILAWGGGANWFWFGRRDR